MTETISIREFGVGAELELHRFGGGAPALFVTAGIHGDEYTGVYTARRLIEYLETHALLRGSVAVMPAVNPAGLRGASRCNPFDGEDINRAFPGDANGGFAARTAAAVFAASRGADMLIDLHACGAHSLPYVLSLHHESARVRALVARLPLPYAVRSDGEAGQLFVEAARRGQTACIVELSSGADECGVDQETGDACLAALLSLLCGAGMLPGAPEAAAPLFGGELRQLDAALTGLWLPRLRRGESFCAGDTVGTADGRAVAAPEDGVALDVLPCAFLVEPEMWVMSYLQPEAGAK